MATRFTPEQQIEATRKKLELAGKAQTTDPRTFFGTRIMLTVLLGGLGFWLFFIQTQQSALNAILLTAAFTALGYYLPIMQLNSQIKRRQNNIIKALPDALDLLTICVEAGLGFDSAMGKVYEKWDNDLAVAFGRVIQEIQLGKQRRDALRDMATRMEVPDVTTFTAAIIQADQLGVSIAKILRIQSDQMRVKRRQRAQEKAQQAPVKMLIPMVFLIFPSIWIVLLGPSLIILRNTNLGGI
jgi:tight adherence protein C